MWKVEASVHTENRLYSDVGEMWNEKHFSYIIIQF